ncbi:MAG: hypothetical protein K2X73_00020 [Sphingomonas sp.]|uniref:hypothetical protein n=1 Tax=Sphingomonas sp. TaxID=28214 RepID=UPI0025EEB842|nr:hypothetical protein [Sphingomonas sp.]MBX9880333.1 hypothetical protein [Sphingomonas sp.]
MKKLAQFDDAWMAAFRDKSGVSDEAALTALRADLLEIGARYRRIIETTPTDLVGSPFNKTLTQRAEWMQVNVVNPAQKLLAALADDQKAWFSTWPYEHEFDMFPDRERMRADLDAVIAFSSRLVRNLKGEQKGDAATNQELRFYIFMEIYGAVRKHLPRLTPKQGVYAKLDDENTKRRVDPFPEAIRHIYAEITGIDEQLVRLIQMCVKDPDWHL